jgi:hypothetical protein
VRDVFRTAIASDFYNKYIRPELAGFTESGRNNLIREKVYDASENRPLPFHHNIASSFQYTSFLEYIPRKNFSDKGYHINQYHLRYNDNFPKTKESNEVRIFVTDGSTAFGMGVLQSETYAYVLEILTSAISKVKNKGAHSCSRILREHARAYIFRKHSFPSKP